jgi:catechol 2,3-dioxygenase-like lactoylglutathione lyase family enzyme
VTVLRMEHLGIVVEDLGEAIDFFTELGLELEGSMTMEDPLVDRLVALDGVSNDFAFMRTPDRDGCLELIQFHTPPAEGDGELLPANTLGLRHVLFAVDDIHDTIARLQARGTELVGELVNYQDSYWLCYLRGPSGIIVELAEKIG